MVDSPLDLYIQKHKIFFTSLTTKKLTALMTIISHIYSYGSMLSPSVIVKYVGACSQSAATRDYKSTDICYRFGLDKDDCARFISTLSLEGTPLNSACPSSRHKGCNSLAKYRNIDGSCNNVQNPSWGSAMTAYTRILFPQYFDGKGVSYRVTISKERKRKKEKKKFKEK